MAGWKRASGARNLRCLVSESESVKKSGHEPLIADGDYLTVWELIALLEG